MFLTTRHITYTGSLVGIHHIVEECRVLWKTEPRLQPIPAELPRDHVPILLTLGYTLQPQRGEASTARGSDGTCKRLQTACRRGANEFFQAVESSFDKAKPRFDMLRENPTADAHWALWVDCMREPAQTFFGLHRTSKRETTNKKNDCRHCVANWFLNKQSAESRLGSSGMHTGTTALNNTCTHGTGSCR